jgi:hypothetical protein
VKFIEGNAFNARHVKKDVVSRRSLDEAEAFVRESLDDSFRHALSSLDVGASVKVGTLPSCLKIPTRLVPGYYASSCRLAMGFLDFRVQGRINAIIAINFEGPIPWAFRRTEPQCAVALPAPNRRAGPEVCRAAAGSGQFSAGSGQFYVIWLHSRRPVVLWQLGRWIFRAGSLVF